MKNNDKLEISVTDLSSSIISSDLMSQFYSGFIREQKEPKTTSTKSRQLAHMLFLMLLPVVILLSFILYFMGKIVVERAEISQVRTDLTFCIGLGRLVHHVQYERDVQVLGLDQVEQSLFILGNIEGTDKSLDELPTTLPAGLSQVPGFGTYNISHIKLQLSQARAARQLQESSNTSFSVYTRVIGVLQKLQLNVILRLQYKYLWKLLVAYYKLVNCTEEVGKQIQFAEQYLRDGQFERSTDLHAYIRAVDQTNNLISQSYKYLPAEAQSINEKMREVLRKFMSLDLLAAFKDGYNEGLSLPPSQAVAKYFDDMMLFKNSLFHFQETLAEMILEQIAEYDRGELVVLGVGIILTLVVTIACPILICTVYKLTTQLQQCAMHIVKATKELRKEKRRTDTLLYQMLPKSVAQKLKKGGVEAEYYRSCTILFCGVADFEEFTTTFNPTDIVNFLNDLFCTLDEVTDKFDVYKVETVGDIYMLSSGVPERNGRDHAAVVASCALEMSGCLGQLRNSWSNNVSLLIGINTGSCVAAVIGSNRPRYCLFGDTVNTAARMQTNSTGNRIQITEMTEKYLRKTKRFIIEPRGMVDIKGKGSMFTYWLQDQVSRPELHPHHGVMMSVSSSQLDQSMSSAGSNSFSSTKGSLNPTDKGLMTSVEQNSMKPISEAEAENPIPTCEPVHPSRQSRRSTFGAGVDWRAAAPQTPVGDEFADSLQELDETFKAKRGSPLIVQLKEGFHF